VEPKDRPGILFPLVGEWSVITTPAYRVPSHGTNYLAQRYAFDLTILDADGSPLPRSRALQYLTTAVCVKNFYAWSKEVLCPGTGNVVDVNDGAPDEEYPSFVRDMIKMRLVAPLKRYSDTRRIFGNYVVVDVKICFILLAHLRTGSILVRPGDNVTAGVKIGEVGNSGNASIPHLHLQAMDQPDPRSAVALQCSFGNVEVWDRHGWRRASSSVPARGCRIRAMHDNAPTRAVSASEVRRGI
jgi:hypothetical protein